MRLSGSNGVVWCLQGSTPPFHCQWLHAVAVLWNRRENLNRSPQGSGMLEAQKRESPGSVAVTPGAVPPYLHRFKADLTFVFYPADVVPLLAQIKKPGSQQERSSRPRWVSSNPAASAPCRGSGTGLCRSAAGSSPDPGHKWRPTARNGGPSPPASRAGRARRPWQPLHLWSPAARQGEPQAEPHERASPLRGDLR